MSGVLVRDVNKRLKLSINLDLKQIRLIYLTCAFELAIYGQSPWCPLFDDREIDGFEYLQEAAYLNKNFGYLYNRNASAEIINRLIETVNFTISHPDIPQTRLFFSHSGNIH